MPLKSKTRDHARKGTIMLDFDNWANKTRDMNKFNELRSDFLKQLKHLTTVFYEANAEVDVDLMDEAVLFGMMQATIGMTDAAAGDIAELPRLMGNFVNAQRRRKLKANGWDVV